MMHEEIKYLKHHRYLKIERVEVTRLARSLSNLYYLQYIIYDNWMPTRLKVDDFLRSDINNLSNLRYLDLNEMGYRIDELKYLNGLCKLGINRLANVKDAKEAYLQFRCYLFITFLCFVLKVRSSLCELEFGQLKSLVSTFLLGNLFFTSEIIYYKLSQSDLSRKISRSGATNNYHLMLSDLSISDPLVLLMEPLRSIASLKMLSIWSNDILVSFSNEQWFLKVRSSLSELQFFFLKSLQSLPSSLESVSSVQILSIHDVPMLRELQNLPPSLNDLTIREYHPEIFERYGEDGGSDRQKIAHIPIYIKRSF